MAGSQNQIACLQRGRAGECDQKLNGVEIGIDVPFQRVRAPIEAQHANDGGVMRMIVGEALGADEDKVLVAMTGDVGVNPVDADPVAVTGDEVADGVMIGGGRAESNRVEDEPVGPGVARKRSRAHGPQ